MNEPSQSGPGESSMSNASPATEGIDGDFYCLRCSYNLRGLTAGQRCPECGVPVSAMDWLDERTRPDPEWIRNFSAAAGISHRVFIVAVVAIALGVGVGLGMGVGMLRLSLLIGLAPGIYFSTAIWRFTVPPTGLSISPTTERRRRQARAALVVALAGAVLLSLDVTGAMVGLGLRLSSLVMIVLMFLFSPLGLAGLVGVWTFTAYFIEIAKAFRAAAVMDNARSVRNGYVVMWILLYAGLLLGFHRLMPVGLLGVLVFIACCPMLPRYLLREVNARMDRDHRDDCEDATG